MNRRQRLERDELYAMFSEHSPDPIPVEIHKPILNPDVFSLENLTRFMKWLSTALMILAALGIVNHWANTILLLNIGTVSWLVTSLLMKEWSLVVVNAVLLGVYFYGLVTN